MAKGYKKKHEEEVIVLESDEISKKEQYDLEKKKRLEAREKKMKKMASKNKHVNSGNKPGLGAKIFAIFMLVLMIGSVLVSVLTPVFS